MEDITLMLVLYAVGIVILVLEIFIPSHGVLSIAGLGFLIAGIWAAFRIGSGVGYVSMILALILVPTGIYFAIKYWYQLPVGKRMAPPNPEANEASFGFHTAELEALIGEQGRAITPLRPVGDCEFGRRRVQCIAEMGSIEKGTKVEAVRIRGRDLVVRQRPS